MRILGWMHRKFRGNETLKDFSIGNPCTSLSRQSSSDDLQCYQNSNSPTKHWNKTPREFHVTNLSVDLESKHLEEDDYETLDSSAANSELFHGFLTIGTFGSDPTSTPTFSISFENLAEKNEEVTEDDLKMINDELEKALGNEEDDAYFGRNSNASTITLAGKVLEGVDTNVNELIDCPLQEYLFGSTFDLTETTLEKKEQRASLGDLFQRENHGHKNDKGGKRKEKSKNMSAVHILKNMLKKTPSTEKKAGSESTNRKLDKIRKIFHRKVYPEGLMAPQKTDKFSRKDSKNNINNRPRYKNEDHISREEDTMFFPYNNLSKLSKGCFKGHSSLSEDTANGGHHDGNGEFWIKTDSDYLVLEL